MDNAGQGGGNAGDAQDGNAGAPPVDNAGTPPADAADTALEPGEHRCPVGYLVLETQNKFGAFCEEVVGFKAAPRKGHYDWCVNLADADRHFMNDETNARQQGLNDWKAKIAANAAEVAKNFTGSWAVSM
jgi:hypothetical protein